MALERMFICADLENLFGDARRHTFDLNRTIAATVETLQRLERRGVLLGGIAIGDRDIVKKTMFELAIVGLRPRVRRTGGRDAADLELIDYVEGSMPRSATTLVVASGDGIFSGLVERLTDRGLRVDVLAVPGTLSHELYRAAHHYIPLEIAA